MCRNNRVRSRLTVAVIVVAFPFSAGGCGFGRGPTPTSTVTPIITPPVTTTTAPIVTPPVTTMTAPIVTPPVTSMTIMTPQAYCTGVWTTPLALQAQSIDEIPYLSKIFACTTQAGDATELINTSDIVWEIDSSPGGRAVRHAPADWKQAIFRSSVPAAYNAVMEPHSSISVAAPPASTSWYASPALTVLWKSQDTYIRATEDKATEQFKKVLPEVASPSSKRGQAWIVCGLAAYDLATSPKSSGDSSTDTSDVSSLVTFAQQLGQSSANCRDRIHAADAQDLLAGDVKAATLPEAKAIATGDQWINESRNSLRGAKLLEGLFSRFHL